jgi:hypothetical protein
MSHIVYVPVYNLADCVCIIQAGSLVNTYKDIMFVRFCLQPTLPPPFVAYVCEQIALMSYHRACPKTSIEPRVYCSFSL